MTQDSSLKFFPMLCKTIRYVLILAVLCWLSATAFSQTQYQPYNFTANQPYNNYMANSSAFKQEVARVEINVVRNGRETLSITDVPRLQKDDVLKIHLLDEVVNGIKPDQSNFDWTFLVAFINPGRNTDSAQSVSEEIQFKKTGWYKDYSIVVPYDSQPIFFLYTKPKYRAKILNLIEKNQDDIRKIGEKTIELSGAYAKIGSFLNELQYVINRSQYYNGYSNYNSYGNYNPYGTYGSYGNYNGNSGSTWFNQNLFVEQSVERLARSFNIQLPNCFNNGYNTYNNGYNTYQNNGYNNYSYYGTGNDFMGRIQCVAKSVRFEDFDISVSRMLQQGGILAAAQLSQKYPQIAYWINIAAVALDFILKLTRKSPLRIVPTVITTNGAVPQNFSSQQNYQQGTMPQQQFLPMPNGVSGKSVKISLYAESPPSDSGFVTAYPLVVSKWQANTDPEIISLPTPVLMDQCLHAGQNILKSTDLMNDWMSDNFTREFELVISATNGFRKEFPLKKNVGMGGWELNLTKEDLNSFPKISMSLSSMIVGKRGFNEVQSPKFDLPVPTGSSWEINDQSQKGFAVGGKRLVTLRNTLGNCRCLQAVVYKPSFGGEFVFEAGNRENGLIYSIDGKEVSLEIDTTGFQPGAGQLELRQFGGETSSLPINLFPPPPQINDVKMARGDSRAVIYGERLEQLKAVNINGKRANVVDRSTANVPPAPGSLPNNAQSSNNATGNNQVQTQVTVAFENTAARQDGNTVSLELVLDENRVYPYPKTFNVTLARPAIVADEAGNVVGTPVSNSLVSAFDLKNLPVFSIETSGVSLIVQNALTDHDFKPENIQVEARIENSQNTDVSLIETNFEVLDWKNIKLNLNVTEQGRRLLGGRRLQFRIRDKERGDSNWYTVKQTFIRMPQIKSVHCSTAKNANCEVSGEGIEYISQVSVDGGKTWFPGQSATLTVQPTTSGSKIVTIPYFTNKNLLKIRLRDFPIIEGLPVANYSLLNGR